jgi:predicted nucleic acid-binding protein
MSGVDRPLRVFMAELHGKRSERPIVSADGRGLFPDAAVGDVPPVVVDANTLRNDVLYGCAHGDQATTLVTAANSGFIRLFCARHVLDEVVEHHARWAHEKGVPIEAFVSLWDRHYAPLLRLVAEVPDGLLGPEESRRVEELRQVDPDDIPSVTLALLLEAFYLSEDGPATTAVYGREHPSEELRAWRRVLQAGGDAGLLGSMFEGATALASGFAGEMRNQLSRRAGGWSRGFRLGVGAAVLGGTGILAHRLLSIRQRDVREVIRRAAEAAAALRDEHTSALEQLRAAQPTTPSWAELGAAVAAENVLLRACLRCLARSQRSGGSAVELAERLPALPVAQGQAKVRALLRSQPCFIEVSRGRWQLGSALSHTMTEEPR